MTPGICLSIDRLGTWYQRIWRTLRVLAVLCLPFLGYSLLGLYLLIAEAAVGRWDAFASALWLALVVVPTTVIALLLLSDGKYSIGFSVPLLLVVWIAVVIKSFGSGSVLPGLLGNEQTVILLLVALTALVFRSCWAAKRLFSLRHDKSSFVWKQAAAKRLPNFGAIRGFSVRKFEVRSVGSIFVWGVLLVGSALIIYYGFKAFVFGVLFDPIAGKGVLDQYKQRNAVIPFIMVVSGVVGLALFLLASARLKRALRYTAPELSELDRRPPLLLLRSFADDDARVSAKSVWQFARFRKLRLEEAIAEVLLNFGPFVAIGAPGERLPQLGSFKTYFTESAWQEEVVRMILGSRLIVMIAGRTNWVLWELGEVVRAGAMNRLVLMFPPVDREERSARWRTIA